MPEHQQTQQSTESKSTVKTQATPLSQTPISHPMAIIQRARINPKSLTHADVMQLQRTIGNRAVGRLLSEIGLIPSKPKQAPPVQRQELVQRQEIPEEEEPLQGKFEIGPEKETCPSCMQRQEIPEEEEPLQGKMIGTIQRQEIPEEEEPLQGKLIEPIQRQEIPEEEEPLQGKFENKPEIACPSCSATPIVQRQKIPEEEEPLQGKMIGTVQRQEIPEEEEPLQTKRKNKTGMPDNLKAGVENLSGIDMSDVRVHYNSSKPAEVGALAYTQGTNIHVAPGQEKHLPHEAWHVVQQAQGRVKPTMQLKEGVAVNNYAGLEKEADLMGAKALHTKTDKKNESPHNVFSKGLLLNGLTLQRVKIDEKGQIYGKFTPGDIKIILDTEDLLSKIPTISKKKESLLEWAKRQERELLEKIMASFKNDQQGLRGTDEGARLLYSVLNEMLEQSGKTQPQAPKKQTRKSEPVSVTSTPTVKAQTATTSYTAQSPMDIASTLDAEWKRKSEDYKSGVYKGIFDPLFLNLRIGNEFTFTSAELKKIWTSLKGKTDTDLDVARAQQEGAHIATILPTWNTNVKALSSSHPKFEILGPEQEHRDFSKKKDSLNVYKYTFSSKESESKKTWSYKVTADDGVVEIVTDPATIEDIQKGFIGEIMDIFIFNVATKSGLAADKDYGGGHINIDFKTFKETGTQIAPFIAEFESSRPFWEAIDTDSSNAPFLHELLKSSQVSCTSFYELFHEFLTGKKDERQFLKELSNIYTNCNVEKAEDQKRRYHALNLSHLIEPPETQRIEVRRVPAQHDRQELMKELEVIISIMKSSIGRRSTV